MAPMAQGQGRPGDWNCGSCGNNNFANRVVCNKCSLPKGAGGYGAMGCKGGAKGQRAVPYGGPTPQNAGKGAPNGMRPGDWCCHCGNHNYGSRTACGKCNAPKGSSGGSQDGQVVFERPGDWKCFACSNVNYAARTECNKCKVPKDVFISKSGLRAGDWICAACANHNYANKTECNKCTATKANETVAIQGQIAQQLNSPTGVRPGDWMCSSCNNHNYANKSACNKCSAPKPTGGSATQMLYEAAMGL